MGPIKTRYLIRTPRFLGVDYILDLALIVVIGPLFVVLPQFSTIYFLLILFVHIMLWRYLNTKPDKFIQNRARYWIYDQGVWFKLRDRNLNKELM
jgi:hypothetical protein